MNLIAVIGYTAYALGLVSIIVCFQEIGGEALIQGGICLIAVLSLYLWLTKPKKLWTGFNHRQ